MQDFSFLQDNLFATYTLRGGFPLIYEFDKNKQKSNPKHTKLYDTLKVKNDTHRKRNLQTSKRRICPYAKNFRCPKC